jgi:hypothetical protein
MYIKKIPENAGNVPEVPECTCKFRCPFMFRAIVKRHAMTGSRLGRYAKPASPRVSAGMGGACAVNSPAGFCMKYFQPEFDEKFSRPLLKTVSHDLSQNEVLLLDILHELGVWKDA